VGSVAPGPQDGEKPLGRAHGPPKGLKAPTQPRPETRVEAKASVEGLKAGPTVGATATPEPTVGVDSAALGSQEAPNV